MSKKNYNVKCQPECKRYDKNKPYNEQDCIYLHRMYYDRTKILRYQDNSNFRNTDLFIYHRLRNRKQEIVINTSICYQDYNKVKKDNRKKSDVPTF